MDYQPLPPQQGDNAFFRLLSLEPGTCYDPIVCQLQTATIPCPDLQGPSKERCPAYEAVSYTWGPKVPMREINLGYWVVRVRENLWHFLHHRRDSAEPTLLWVDALCIDQSNLIERASQVQLMKRIYGGAQRVLVWLGPADNSSRVAMKLIEDRATDQCHETHIFSTDYESLREWMDRSYWTRTWVVQEFLCASEISLVCGSWQISGQEVWHYLSNVHREAMINRKLHDILQNFGIWPANLLMQQRNTQGSSGIPLESLLLKNQSANCEDPRDKVYAMLGLAKQSPGTPNIEVSYTKDARTLLFEVIAHCRTGATDIPRYVKFLAAQLRITPDQLSSAATGDLGWHSFSDQKIWTVRGFIAGEILLDGAWEPHDVVGEAMLLHVLERLNDTDRNQSILGQDILDAISQRTWRREVLETTNALALTPTRAYTKRVMVSDYEGKGTWVGLASNNVKPGDLVVYFLGHEMALTMATAKPRLTGQVLLKMQGGSPTRDAFTGQANYFHTIQDDQEGFDGIDTLDLVNLLVTSAELLSLSGCSWQPDAQCVHNSTFKVPLSASD